MYLDIDAVHCSPPLTNFHLEGPGHISSVLFFTHDDNYLLSEDFSCSTIAVWNVNDKLFLDRQWPVLACCLSSDIPGAYILNECGLVFQRFYPDRCDLIDVSSFSLAGCVNEEVSCSLMVSKKWIVASRREKAIIMRANDAERQSWVDLPPPINKCSTKIHLTHLREGKVFIELLDVDIIESGCNWHHAVVQFPSLERATKTFSTNNLRSVVRSEGYFSFLAILSKEEGRVLARYPSATLPVREFNLNLSPNESKLYLSRNGYLIAEKTESELTIWKLGEEYRRFGVDKNIASVRLSDDGDLCALVYYQLDQSPADHNLTAFIDLKTMRIIGHGKDHVEGFFSSSVFSPSGKYFASLIIDNTAIGHPSGLPSGTVVITQLRP